MPGQKLREKVIVVSSESLNQSIPKTHLLLQSLNSMHIFVYTVIVRKIVLHWGPCAQCKEVTVYYGLVF